MLRLFNGDLAAKLEAGEALSDVIGHFATARTLGVPHA